MLGCIIMPIFWLFPGLNSQEPAKSGRLAAKAATVTRQTKANKAVFIFLLFSISVPQHMRAGEAGIPVKPPSGCCRPAQLKDKSEAGTWEIGRASCRERV